MALWQRVVGAKYDRGTLLSFCRVPVTAPITATHDLQHHRVDPVPGRAAARGGDAVLMLSLYEALQLGAKDTEFEEFGAGVGRARGVSSRGPPAGRCGEAAASPCQLRGLDSPPTPAGDGVSEGAREAGVAPSESLPCAAGLREEPAAPPALHELIPGMEVRMIGLQVRLELNDEVGVLVQRDGKTGRWQVRLRGRGDMLLKGVNLEPAHLRDPPARDIALVMAQAQCSRESAVAALLAEGGDPVLASCALQLSVVGELEPKA